MGIPADEPGRQGNRHGERGVPGPQLVAQTLGLDPAEVLCAPVDTDLVWIGSGTFGSRAVVAGGGALIRAADRIKAKAVTIAAATPIEDSTRCGNTSSDSSASVTVIAENATVRPAVQRVLRKAASPGPTRASSSR